MLQDLSQQRESSSSSLLRAVLSSLSKLDPVAM